MANTRTSKSQDHPCTKHTVAVRPLCRILTTTTEPASAFVGSFVCPVILQVQGPVFASHRSRKQQRPFDLDLWTCLTTPPSLTYEYYGTSRRVITTSQAWGQSRTGWQPVDESSTPFFFVLPFLQCSPTEYKVRVPHRSRGLETERRPGKRDTYGRTLVRCSTTPAA